MLENAAGRLIQVPDVSPFPNSLAAYRIDEDDSFTRIFRLTMSSANPYEWIALSPDGVRHYFANGVQGADDAELRVERWHLVKQVDPYGNTVEYIWDFAAATLTLAPVLQRIEYSSNPGAGLDAHAKVEFDYAPIEVCRGTTVPMGAQYHQGGYYEGVRRLRAIETYVRDEPGADRPLWRASLESPQSGERLGFADLASLVAFLEEQTGQRRSEDTNRSAKRVDRRDKCLHVNGGLHAAIKDLSKCIPSQIKKT